MRSSRRESAGPESGFGLVETLVAIVVFGLGMLAVAGVALSVGWHMKSSTYRTGQTLAAQQILENTVERGYQNVAAGVRVISVDVGNHAYAVRESVEVAGPRVKEAWAVVPGTRYAPDVAFSTVLHKARSLPVQP